MCFFFSFLPATFWLVIGYFVLYSSSRTNGSLRAFGRGLAAWVFILSALIVVAGAYITLRGWCPLGALAACGS